MGLLRGQGRASQSLGTTRDGLFEDFNLEGTNKGEVWEFDHRWTLSSVQVFG